MAVTAGAKAVPGAGGELNREQFAEKVLQSVGIPVNKTSVGKFVAWEKQEGGHWNNTARYNPLNTTLALPGAANTGTQGNIKVYNSWQQGIEATVKTLKAPSYAGILANLKSGTVADFKIAVNTSPWGTKFSNLGEAIEPTEGLFGPAEKQGGVTQTAEQGLEEAGHTISGLFNTNWGELGMNIVLLLAGAALVVYGIMVAVRPRESAFSLPRMPMPVPV